MTLNENRVENIGETTFSQPAKQLLADQHSLLLSMALHLVPGVLIMLAYWFIASPLVQAMGYPPYLALVIAMCIALAPVQLGLLLYLGWKRNGKLSLRGVVQYTEKPLKRRSLIGFIIVLIIGLFIASVVLAPVDAIIYRLLFSWIPFENTGGAGGFVAGYERSTVIVTLAVSLILTGITLPAIEELYFRGFLLPRLSRFGRWSPVVNIGLFSLYHFWTPWQFVSRIGFFLPTVWVTWRKQDLRVSLWVHCLSNTLVQALTLLAILSGAAL